MREISRHQQVHSRQRGLDGLSLDGVVPAELGQRVFELVLAGEHARGEWLPAGRVDRVLELAQDDTAHRAAYCFGGVVVHSRIACWLVRSMWTLLSTRVTQLSGM